MCKAGARWTLVLEASTRPPTHWPSPAGLPMAVPAGWRRRSHLLADGLQVLVLHQVLAEMDPGEAGAAGVREKAEEALVRLKVAGGVDQLHVPGREKSLASGKGPGTLVVPQGSAPALLSLKPSLTTRQQLPSPPSPAPLSNSTCLDPDRPAGEMKVAPGPRRAKVMKGPLINSKSQTLPPETVHPYNNHTRPHSSSLSQLLFLDRAPPRTLSNRKIKPRGLTFPAG